MPGHRFYEGEYNPWLVLLSYGFAVFGSYAGLVISRQIASIKAQGTKNLWIAAGAFAMGGRCLVHALHKHVCSHAPNAPEILVSGYRDGTDAVFSFEDHGLGIDKDDLASVFNRFLRAKTSEGIAGTGVGLNLIKHLAEQHDGTITEESIKGKGSVFTVGLPIEGPADSDEDFKPFTMAKSG